jgi:hypothetical protein
MLSINEFFGQIFVKRLVNFFWFGLYIEGFFIKMLAPNFEVRASSQNYRMMLNFFNFHI